MHAPRAVLIGDTNMKQFQYISSATGFVHGPYDLTNARFYLNVPLGSSLDPLHVGQTWTDPTDGDVWTRLSDVDSTSADAVSDEPQRDERLERIATAALQGLLASGRRSPTDAALDAVVHARALIIELDKPE
jgi:hypothetical protein